MHQYIECYMTVYLAVLHLCWAGVCVGGAVSGDALVESNFN